MRYGTINRPYFDVELHDIEEDSNGRPVRQTFRESARLSLDTGDGSALTLYSERPLRVGTVVTNVRDRFGALIYPTTFNTTGHLYRIYDEDPIITPFGTREGFVARAERVA